MNAEASAPGEAEYGHRDWEVIVSSKTRGQARFIAWLLRIFGLSRSEASDPRVAIHFVLDRVTAQWLRAALSANDSIIPNFYPHDLILVSPGEAREGIHNLVDTLDVFLANSFPYAEELNAPE